MTENHRDPDLVRGLDRRQLLKAGVWAAPVLVLTTAVPASAASVTPTDVILRFTHAYAFYAWDAGHKTGLTVTTKVEADSQMGTSTTSVTLVFTVEALGLSTTAAPSIATGGPAWTSTGPAVANGSSLVFTFLWAGNIPAFGNTGEIRFTLAGDANSLDGVVNKGWTALATSPGATSATASGSTLRATDPGEPLPPTP